LPHYPREQRSWEEKIRDSSNLGPLLGGRFLNSLTGRLGHRQNLQYPRSNSWRLYHGQAWRHWLNRKIAINDHHAQYHSHILPIEVKKVDDPKWDSHSNDWIVLATAQWKNW
jgi:hypothetical protein